MAGSGPKMAQNSPPKRPHLLLLLPQAVPHGGHDLGDLPKGGAGVLAFDGRLRVAEEERVGRQRLLGLVGVAAATRALGGLRAARRVRGGRRRSRGRLLGREGLKYGGGGRVKYGGGGGGGLGGEGERGGGFGEGGLGGRMGFGGWGKDGGDGG